LINYYYKEQKQDNLTKNHTSNQKPDMNQGYQPYMNQQYKPDINQGYQSHLNQEYKSDINQRYQPYMNQQYEPNNNQGYPPHSNQEYKPDINQGYQPYMNQQYQPDINQINQSSLNQGYQPSWNQGYQPSWNQEYQPNLNQGYQPSHIQGYQSNLNQLYQPDMNLVNQPYINQIYQPSMNQRYQPDIKEVNQSYIHQTNQPNMNQIYQSNMNQQYQPGQSETGMNLSAQRLSVGETSSANNYNSINNNFNENAFQNIVQKYEINTEFAQKMQQLRGFEIVLIFDDSGSMRSKLKDSPLNKGTNQRQATRWDELKAYGIIAVEILSLFDSNGIDIHFLNRPPIKNVKQADQIIQKFQSRPAGGTPLTKTIKKVLNETSSIVQRSNLLIVIVTDGEPTDAKGEILPLIFYLFKRELKFRLIKLNLRFC
jgi:archaellin